MAELGIYYVIRHKATKQLMPELRRTRGYSHWNPSKPDSPNSLDPEKILGVPRLLPSRRKAQRCIDQWNSIPNGKQGWTYDGEMVDVDIKPDGRKKEDLEIIEVNLIEN